MSKDINLGELWSKQSAAMPDMDHMRRQIKKLQMRKLTRLIVTNICLGATGIFIIFIWIKFQPEYWTTKFGIILANIAMAIFLMVYNKLFPLYNELNRTLNNQEYLNTLIKIKNKEQLVYARLTGLYHLLLLVAICLYMLEYTMRMQLWQGALAYAVSIGWIMFSWFVISKKQLVKSKLRNEEIIGKLEKIISDSSSV
jgi:hypothetical protein